MSGHGEQSLVSQGCSRLLVEQQTLFRFATKAERIATSMLLRIGSGCYRIAILIKFFLYQSH